MPNFELLQKLMNAVGDTQQFQLLVQQNPVERSVKIEADAGCSRSGSEALNTPVPDKILQSNG